MEKFASLFDKIDQTFSTNEKVQFMREYFEQVPSEDAAWALFFLSGQRIKRLISSKSLFEFCLEATKLPSWIVEESYEAVGDTAETIALLLKPTEEKEIAGLSLSEWMEQRILPLRNRTYEEQKTDVIGFWNQLNQRERFILNKILTGSLRVGVSHLLTLRSVSQALNVPREILSQRLMGTWEPTKEFFDSLKEENHSSSSKYLNPYPFFLASPLEDALESLGDPQEWQAEWKWDGIRAQCIHKGNKFAIWSRGNELISHQFPEILHVLEKIPEGTILDGEILAFKENLPMPFGMLQKRLGCKSPSKKIIEEVPIVFMIYDLLEFKGEDYRRYPLQKRREVFESWIDIAPKLSVSPLVHFQTWDEIREKKLESKQRGTEGIMLKKLDSPYGLGRQRGNWWKYKIDPMTIDAVLIYAQAGKGRRANLYTDYTFGVWEGEQLIPIAKAYSGLSQEEIDRLDRWIRRHTEEKFGPVRKVKAEQVFEIAFEGIQKSNRHKSGVALRFPRISRWRNDKPIEECDTLKKIKETFLL